MCQYVRLPNPAIFPLRLTTSVDGRSWPSTGTSDRLKLRLDSAGIDNAAGVYYHQVNAYSIKLSIWETGFL